MNGIMKNQRNLFFFNLVGTLCLLGGTIASVASML